MLPSQLPNASYSLDWTDSCFFNCRPRPSEQAFASRNRFQRPCLLEPSYQWIWRLHGSLTRWYPESKSLVPPTPNSTWFPAVWTAAKWRGNHRSSIPGDIEQPTSTISSSLSAPARYCCLRHHLFVPLLWRSGGPNWEIGWAESVGGNSRWGSVHPKAVCQRALSKHHSGRWARGKDEQNRLLWSFLVQFSNLVLLSPIQNESVDWRLGDPPTLLHLNNEQPTHVHWLGC